MSGPKPVHGGRIADELKARPTAALTCVVNAINKWKLHSERLAGAWVRVAGA